MARMDPRLALHTAVRRWLPERYSELSGIGSALPTSDQSVRSESEQSLIPRYWLISVLRDEIERLDPDALPSFPDLVEILVNEALTVPVEHLMNEGADAGAL